jgi:hypothetical protein
MDMPDIDALAGGAGTDAEDAAAPAFNRPKAPDKLASESIRN